MKKSIVFACRWDRVKEKSWSGSKYAEGFEAHKILGYCADYRLLP